MAGRDAGAWKIHPGGLSDGQGMLHRAGLGRISGWKLLSSRRHWFGFAAPTAQDFGNEKPGPAKPCPSRAGVSAGDTGWTSPHLPELVASKEGGGGLVTSSARGSSVLVCSLTRFELGGIPGEGAAHSQALSPGTPQASWGLMQDSSPSPALCPGQPSSELQLSPQGHSPSPECSRAGSGWARPVVCQARRGAV